MPAQPRKPSYQPYTLFTYSIDHLAQKDKVLFYYALKGRDGFGGILADKEIIQVGRTVLLLPKRLDKEFSAFLGHWKSKSKKRLVYLER